VDLRPLGILAGVDIATFSCFNPLLNVVLVRCLSPLALCTFSHTIRRHMFFLCYDSLLFSNFGLEFRPQLVVVSGLSMGIPLTMGFRPQLVVVLGLLVGIPFTVGFRPQLVVVSGLLMGIPLTVGFRLPRSLRLSRSPFHKLFFT
jgi:hypothetical protein